MSNNKSTVVLEGAYGEMNFGDDALLKVIYQYIPRDTDEIIICTKTPALSYSLSEFSDEAKVLTRESIDWDSVEHIVYGGGTQFFSFQGSSSFLYKCKLALKKPSLIFSKISSLFDKSKPKAKKHFVGVGVGPFYGKKKASDFKGVFDGADSVFVRDDVSCNYLKEIGIANASVYTDLCFADNLDYIKREVKTKVQRVAVILRDWDHDNNNINVSDIESSISGYEKCYIIFGSDPKLVNDLKRKNLDYIAYNPEVQSFKSFLIELSKFDVFVTSRFHAIVYGMMIGVPSIVLSIEPKLKIASQELFSLGEIDRDNLNRLGSILDNISLEEACESMAQVYESKKMIAEKMLTNVSDILK